jgi:hypothetical protein
VWQKIIIVDILHQSFLKENIMSQVQKYIGWQEKCAKKVVVEELVVCLCLCGGCCCCLLLAAEEQFWHDHNNTQIAGQQAHNNEN